MFAWQAQCAPVTWPASGMQPAPVWTATRPLGVDHADLAHRDERVAGEHAAQAACGALARLQAVERVRPCAGSTTDCVATAPTPGRVHVQSEPTENQWDWTAAPSSPVSGSRATIEYVP